MSITFELDAEPRSDIGKGASRRLRHANHVPAVIYGGGEDPISLTLNHDKVSVALAHEAFYSHILSVKVGKKTEKVILKAIQRHPSRARIQHMDFLRVRADQKLKMHVPLHFIGEEKAPGAKEGGIFQHLMTDVEISCLPAHLPEFIEVDVSKLALDQSVHLSELKLPKNVELTAFAHGVEGHDQAVISIHIPRIIEEEVTEVVAEEEAPAEGEAPQAEASGETDKE
jgi:large subunit ribosomal protein L25